MKQNFKHVKKRLQKLISEYGLMSRRKAEELIRDGRVLINGEIATIGMSADPEVDRVVVDGLFLDIKPKPVYLMLNKPKGYVCTLSDERGRKTVLDLLKDFNQRVFPVGRLDMDSEGLLIMTNDGELANKLIHPRHEVKKTYKLSVFSDDIEKAIERLEKMRELGEEYIRPAEVQLISSKDGEHILHVTIGEGKNRQIRRMCTSAGLELKNLRRIQVGEIKLGKLQQGSWRFLNETEMGYLDSL